MKKEIFMDKYPIYSVELTKDEVAVKNTADIVEVLKAKIEAHPIAKFIAVFDHYTHTKSLDGEIVDGLTDAQNVIFCFGPAIPNPKILAVRPRSIGICEFEDKFVLNFTEPPKEQLNELMESWVKSLKK